MQRGGKYRCRYHGNSIYFTSLAFENTDNLLKIENFLIVI